MVHAVINIGGIIYFFKYVEGNIAIKYVSGKVLPVLVS